MNIYYLCDTSTKSVKYVGELPEVYGNITGLIDASYDTIKDLTWAGYPGLGFLNEDDALVWGVDPEVIKAHHMQNIDNSWIEVREMRDALISNVRWRIDRHDDEIKLGITPTENIMPILLYIQKLREVTNQQDPLNITWPIL